MNKPVLLIVDDDPQVLAAVRRDLRAHYRDNLHGDERGIGGTGAVDRHAN